MSLLNSLPSSSASSLIQFPNQIDIKLTHDNYLLWKSEVIPVICGFGLMSHLIGSSSLPSSLTLLYNGTVTSNPTYEAWMKQDQLILDWLLNSLSDDVLPQVVTCDTARALWHSLEQTYASQSQSPAMDLRLQLQTLKKDSSPISDYLNRMRFIADRLKSIGCDISDDELIIYILNGLGGEYDDFAMPIANYSTTLSFSDFCRMLLTYARGLEAHDLPSLPNTLSRGLPGPAPSLSNSSSSIFSNQELDNTSTGNELDSEDSSELQEVSIEEHDDS